MGGVIHVHLLCMNVCLTCLSIKWSLDLTRLQTQGSPSLRVSDNKFEEQKHVSHDEGGQVPLRHPVHDEQGGCQHWGLGPCHNPSLTGRRYNFSCTLNIISKLDVWRLGSFTESLNNTDIWFFVLWMTLGYIFPLGRYQLVQARNSSCPALLTQTFLGKDSVPKNVWLILNPSEEAWVSG